MPCPHRADPADALLDSLLGALPIDDDSRRHWMVTVAFCAESAGDPELAATQRDAYREFRAHVTALVQSCRPGSDATEIAEQLIASADGIALLFDADSWPPDRQRAALYAALEGADCAAVTSTVAG